MGSGPLLIPPPVGRGRTKKGKGALSSRPMECQTHSAEERKGEQKIYDSDVTEVRRPQPRALAHARTYGSVQEREISSLCVSARVRCRWSRVRRRQVINSHARRAAEGEGGDRKERERNERSGGADVGGGDHHPLFVAMGSLFGAMQCRPRIVGVGKEGAFK